MIKLYKNYIPHRKNCKFDKWFYEYEYQLTILYSICIEILDDRYKNVDESYMEKISFLKFCKFIYNYSSKYILKY